MLKIFLILFAMSFWVMFYKLLRGIVQYSPEYANRLVTLIHGVSMACIGVTECFRDGWAFEVFHHCSFFHSFILLFSLGYFIFDLLWCIYHQSEGTIMMVHHGYSCFALYRVWSKKEICNQAVCALGGMELTNPLLQTRWFLRTHGFSRSGGIFILVEVLFCSMFIFVRIIVGTVVGVNIVFSRKHDMEFKFLAILIYVVSWLFFLGICRLICRKFIFAQTSNELGSNTQVNHQQPVNNVHQ